MPAWKASMLICPVWVLKNGEAVEREREREREKKYVVDVLSTLISDNTTSITGS